MWTISESRLSAGGISFSSLASSTVATWALAFCGSGLPPFSWSALNLQQSFFICPSLSQKKHRILGLPLLVSVAETSTSAVSTSIASASRAFLYWPFLFRSHFGLGLYSLGFQGLILTSISLYLCTTCLATVCHLSMVTGRMAYSERIFLCTALVRPLKKISMLPLSCHDHPALVKRTSK